MSINSRVLTSAVMLAIFAGMTGIALGFPAQAQLMPLLVALLAANMDSAKTVTKRSEGETPSVEVTSSDIAPTGTDAYAIAIATLWLGAMICWFETQVVQRGFVTDAARAMSPES